MMFANTRRNKNEIIMKTNKNNRTDLYLFKVTNTVEEERKIKRKNYCKLSNTSRYGENIKKKGTAAAAAVKCDLEEKKVVSVGRSGGHKRNHQRWRCSTEEAMCVCVLSLSNHSQF